MIETLAFDVVQREMIYMGHLGYE